MMAIVVVGGQTKGVGKTSVAAGLIRALPERHWTAFKISLARSGEDCGGIEVREERDREAGTDSARFLAAGAVRSFWVRASREDLAEAMARIQPELEAAENAVFESNSVLEFLRPDVYLSVMDPGTRDFKESALRLLERADAVLVPEEMLGRVAVGAPVFVMRLPDYVTEEMVRFVSQRLGMDKKQTGLLASREL